MKSLKETEEDYKDAIYEVSTCAISGAVGTFANINPKVESLCV